MGEVTSQSNKQCVYVLVRVNIHTHGALALQWRGQLGYRGPLPCFWDMAYDCPRVHNHAMQLGQQTLGIHFLGHAQHFMSVLGIRLRHECLQGLHFTDGSITSPLTPLS